MIKPPDSSVSKVGAVAPGSPVERVRGDAGRLLVAVQQASAQGPGFMVGEAVSARLVEPLQNRQFVALVKNAVVTLQWPTAPDAGGGGAMVLPDKGETLLLRVVSLTPRLSFALVDAAPPVAVSNNAVAVQLSAAAQALNTLVQAGERRLSITPPESMPTLLGDPAAAPAERAQAVAQAVAHSGLFYESHLLAWAEGRMPLAELGREPQARIAQALQDASAASPASPAARETANAELGGVLQRQLDALDGKPLDFAGFAWPGQPAQWRIQRDTPDARDDEPGKRPPEGGSDELPSWSTQIQLDLPRLGALGAQLRVIGTQVTLAMTVDSASGASLLAMHRERLATALQAAGLGLAALTVQTRSPPMNPRHEPAEEP